MNSWITIDIKLVFTFIKSANLGDSGLYLVVEADGWRLHNDTTENSYLFNEVYKTQKWPNRFKLLSTADFSRVLDTTLKSGILSSKWLIPACDQYPHKITKQQSRISMIETVLRGKISDYSPTLWYLFMWQCSHDAILSLIVCTSFHYHFSTKHRSDNL